VELNGFKVFVVHGILIAKKIATLPESNSIDVLLISTKPFVDD
jgi:predicted phosphodiesterase